MKPKSALFFLLCPLLSLGGISGNPAQAQIRESCPYAEIYVENEPPIETRAICQAARPLAAEGLSVVIFVTDSAGSLRSSSWDTEEWRVKNDSGLLQGWFETDFAPDGLFLAVHSHWRGVSNNEVIVVPTLGENLYNSPAEADRIIRVITREIEAGLRNDTLTEGIVTALGKTHRLLYGPNLALMLLISLPAGVIILRRGVLLYRRQKERSQLQQQREQIQLLISTWQDSSHDTVEPCDQSLQWVEDLSNQPERYILCLRDLVRFIEVQVTQKRGLLNFCRYLWRRGQPRFPEPEVQVADAQNGVTASSPDQLDARLTDSRLERAIDLMMAEIQTNREQVVQDNIAPIPDDGVPDDGVAEARQRIVQIQYLIDQRYYLLALEVWKQTQIELVQFAIAQLQQRRQAAEAHYFEWQHKREHILRYRAKYSQYLETIERRLETGNITELLKLQRDLVSLLYFVKHMERSADFSLEFKKRRHNTSGTGSTMSTKDTDRLINFMFDSDGSSKHSNSWSSGRSSSWGSSRRSSSRGSSRRSSGSRGSSRRW